MEVTAGQVLIFHVTGTEATDFGAFKLSLNLQKPGSTLSLATYLDGSAGPVGTTGDNEGYPNTFTSPCTATNKSDGPDAVSVGPVVDIIDSDGCNSQPASRVDRMHANCGVAPVRCF